MTRVLHVLDHGLPLHSGYAFRTRAIMAAQLAAGMDVRAITGVRQGTTATGANPEIVDGLTFYRTPGRLGSVAGLREMREIGALADALERLCENWRPDVFHAHSPLMNGLAASRAGSALGIPVVYEIRAFWEDAAVGNGTGSEGSLRYRMTRSLENRAVAAADAVVTICKGLRDDLVIRGVAPGKITIVPNAVDLNLFGSPLPRDAALARELDLGEGPVIGFLGSFYPYEGLADLIAAMPAIVEAHPGARLLLIGGGPEADALRAAAERSSAAPAIRFVGRVPHAEVERYYSLVDVVAYPRKAMRLTELVTPLKPLEAMAQGKMVAASAVGGHRELIVEGMTGTLFAPDDPAALAAALNQLLSRRDEWPARRIVASEFVRRERDWAGNVERYRTVYQRLLERGPIAASAAAA
ncbi:TIGR04063 family PEP-CTERM/XrtA system glycosyltransferase [Novosphingobium tardum]|uniref:TIGR04063 family PEP-CTERM/XrtA system glycosyltransferase n=1 Tax=Novosphingobium tardum TaxID=1538021 RepID=A0ABV8RM25_9SPHN